MLAAGRPIFWPSTSTPTTTSTALFQVGRRVRKILLHRCPLGTSRQVSRGFPLRMANGWLHISNDDQAANHEPSLSAIFIHGRIYRRLCPDFFCALGPDALAGEAVMAVAALPLDSTHPLGRDDLVILRVFPWRARLKSSTVPGSVEFQ